MGSRYNSHKSIDVNDSIGTDQYIRKNIGWSFTRSRREYGQHKADITPGPGSYSNVMIKTNNDSKSQTGFGLSKRLEDGSKETIVTPGPGNYDISTKIGHSSSGVTIKHRGEDLEFKYRIKNPGPWDYNTQSIEILHKKSPAWILRPKHSNDDSKSKIDTKILTPGPASYLPKIDSIKKVTAKWKMSTSGRNVMNAFKLNTPGPGTYTYDNINSKGTMFPKSKRIDLAKSTYAPGPGSYSPSDINLKQIPSYTLRAKEFNKKSGLNIYKDNVPGPGMYNPTLHRKSNSIGFGKSKRGDIALKSQIDTPGPGAYTIPSRVAEVPYYEANKLDKSQH